MGLLSQRRDCSAWFQAGAEHLTEAFGVMTLAVELSLAGEAADKTFAAEQTADQAGTGFDNLELHGVFEGHDVAGVNGVLAVDFNLVDGSEAGQKNISLSLGSNPERAFTAEQGFAEPLPGGIDGDAWSAGEPAGALDQKSTTSQSMMDDIALHGWPKNQDLIFLLRGEVVEEVIFAGEHSLHTA